MNWTEVDKIIDKAEQDALFQVQISIATVYDKYKQEQRWKYWLLFFDLYGIVLVDKVELGSELNTEWILTD